ncbi:ribbon-helix-helix protein, CopG family [Archaeoglobus sp.]
MGVTLTARVDERLAKLIDEIVKGVGMDRSTVMRRFLARAVRVGRVFKISEFDTL